MNILGTSILKERVPLTLKRMHATRAQKCLALLLQISKGRPCRERVVDISLWAMRVVSLLVRRCQLKVVFEAKREIRLSDENILDAGRANNKWDHAWFH